MDNFKSWFKEDLIKTALGIMFNYSPNQKIHHMKEAEHLIDSLQNDGDLYARMIKTYQGWNSEEIYEDLMIGKSRDIMTPQAKERVLAAFKANFQ